MMYIREKMESARGKTSVKRSFTLVETLVAIAIIMITIVGPFDSIQNALNAAYISRDELTANALAQEGVEWIVDIRDKAYLYNRLNPTATQLTFLAGVDGTSNSPAGNLNANCITNNCTVDPPNSSDAVCSASGCPPLYINSTTGLYNQAQSGTVSRFTRSVRICYVGSGGSCGTGSTNEAKITVTVTWMTGTHPGSTVITEYLQNWL